MVDVIHDVWRLQHGGIHTTSLTTGRQMKHAVDTCLTEVVDYRDLIPVCQVPSKWDVSPRTMDDIQWERKTVVFEQGFLIFKTEVTYPKLYKIWGCKTANCSGHYKSDYSVKHFYQGNCYYCNKDHKELYKHIKKYRLAWRAKEKCYVLNHHNDETTLINAVNMIPKKYMGMLSKLVYSNTGNQWAGWGNCRGGLEFFKARMEHQCVDCDGMISIGEHYLTTKYFYGSRDKYHLRCFNPDQTSHSELVLCSGFAYDRYERAAAIVDMHNSIPGRGKLLEIPKFVCHEESK